MKMESGRRELTEEAVQSVMGALDKLSGIWDEIGLYPQQRLDRTKVVLKHVSDLLTDMVSEEEQMKAKLLRGIKEFQEEIQLLCKELQKPLHEPEEGLSVLLLEKHLRLQVDVLSREKHQRVKRLKRLREEDQHLCDVLCTIPYYIPTGSIPSDGQLEGLEMHVKSLNEEKERRHALFKATRQNIIKLMEDLEKRPNNEFERDIVCETDDSFLLSTENMEALKQLHEGLEEKQKENFSLASELRDRMTQLWNRLDIPTEERNEFCTTYAGFKPKTIEAMQEEILRLNQLKIANMRNVIEATRVEIQDWWKKCYISPAERMKFHGFQSDDFSEELLELHDQEVARLKQYYRRYEDMFELVEKRQELWQNYVEFERKASDPNRFFNRGCNLLKEEKARKKLMKELPRVEDDVKLKIEDWERENGCDFLLEGMRFIDFINHQVAKYNQEKEIEKTQRHKDKVKQMEEEMTFGSKPITPAKRRFLATPGGSKTPNKMRKVCDSTTQSGSSQSSGASSTHSSIAPKFRFGETMTPGSARTPGGSVSRLARTPNHHSLFMSPACTAPRSASRLASHPTKTPTNRPPRPVPSSDRTRRALAERNCTTNDSNIFSQTTVSAQKEVNQSTVSLASLGPYAEFAKDLNINTRSNHRSSVIPKPAAFF